MSDISRNTITVAEWCDYLFVRPVSGSPWYEKADAELWEVPSDQLVPLLAATLERSAELLAPFPDAQLSQGLWLLANANYSAYLSALLDDEVPWPERKHALRSMFYLFRDVFARRCSPHLSHLSEQVGWLNGICYMWWDLMTDLQLPGQPRAPDFDAEVVSVMGQVLALPHDACRESALHGLGHWQDPCPWAAEVIEEFIRGNPGLRPELITYARQAQTGDVQ